MVRSSVAQKQSVQADRTNSSACHHCQFLNNTQGLDLPQREPGLYFEVPIWCQHFLCFPSDTVMLYSCHSLINSSHSTFLFFKHISQNLHTESLPVFSCIVGNTEVHWQQNSRVERLGSLQLVNESVLCVLCLSKYDVTSNCIYTVGV